MSTPQTFQHRILSSTRQVVERAKSVSISAEGIALLATAMLADLEWLVTTPTPSQRDAHLFASDAEYAQWIFALDCLNFSFWSKNEAERWRWPKTAAEDHSFKGAIALYRSFRDAHERGIPFTDATFLERLTTPVLGEILGGTGILPLLDERRQVLNETGSALNRHYDGQIINLIKACTGSANEALRLITRDFPSFRDITRLDGDEVYLLKRAQIFISDLWLLFGGKSAGQFDDIHTLTAFADYKLPQILRAHDVLRYSPELSARIDNYVPLPHGSREEIEIRAATIQAVEQLRAKLTDLSGHRTLSCLLDNSLWWLSQDEEFNQTAAPHHLTRTIYY